MKVKTVMSASTLDDLKLMLAKFWCSTPDKVNIDVDFGTIVAPSGNISSLVYAVKRGRHCVLRKESEQ